MIKSFEGFSAKTSNAATIAVVCQQCSACFYRL